MLDNVLQIAIQAGREILDVYENDFEVDTKADGSPLTRADRRAHELIEAQLHDLDPEIPVLSEESSPEVFAQRLSWSRFWLVDPLDGTKEFIKRNGEFTVNIALIEDGSPVLGVVHTPVKQHNHFAARDLGAFKQVGTDPLEPIGIRTLDPDRVTMVASRSHAGPEVANYRQALEQEYAQVAITSMGSSLKICLVAEGTADIYPRLGPTSEWDTAAAHCVLENAGGRLTDLKGQALTYNKPDILNPWFLASGDKSLDWTRYAR